MALLIEADRKQVARAFIRKLFEEMNKTATIDTVAIKAAVDDTDQWLENNAGSYNLALPQPFRGQANSNLKTSLLTYVALKRAGLI